MLEPTPAIVRIVRPLLISGLAMAGVPMLVMLLPAPRVDLGATGWHSALLLLTLGPLGLLCLAVGLSLLLYARYTRRLQPSRFDAVLSGLSCVALAAGFVLIARGGR